MKARPHLSLTLPYRIEFALCRAKKDGSDRPCIVRWSPAIDGFSPAGFVLLHEETAAGGFKTHAVDQTGFLEPPEEDSIAVDYGRDNFLWELAPGAEVRFAANLPARYYAALRDGEAYTLLYPGGEVAMWDYGTIQEHLGRAMKARHPTIMIPGEACISFNAQMEKTQWPGRAPYEAEYGFDMANLAEQRWRQEEARKSMRIIEGWPAPIGSEERVQVYPIFPLPVKYNTCQAKPI